MAVLYFLLISSTSWFSVSTFWTTTVMPTSARSNRGSFWQIWA